MLTTWPDNTVRIAQIRTQFYLTPNTVNFIDLAQGKTPYRAFTFHPEILNKFNQGVFNEGLSVTAKINGADATCFPFMGQTKVLRQDSVVTSFRVRSYYRTAQNETALSCTAYFELESDSPIIRMTLVNGNDTREKLVGNLHVENLTLNSTLPHSALHQEAYGSYYRAT